MNVTMMSASELRTLKGAELKEAAASMQIEGRSKMKADELREALVAAVWPNPEHRNDAPAEDTFPEDADADKTFTEDDNGNWTEATAPVVVPGPSNDLIQAAEPEKWEVVPNRAARREAERRQRKARGRIAMKQNRNR